MCQRLARKLDVKDKQPVAIHTQASTIDESIQKVNFLNSYFSPLKP